MAVQFLALQQRATANDATSNPLAGAKIYTYQTGTTTPLTTYTTSALSVANANPIVADSAGRFGPIYTNGAVALKVVIETSAGATVDTIDPVPLVYDASAAASSISLTPNAVITSDTVQEGFDEFEDIMTGLAARHGIPDGTVTTPGLYFGTDGNNGLYLVGADVWGCSAGGTLIQSYRTTGLRVHVNGTAAAPSVAFASDPTSGLYYGALATPLGFSTNGTARGGVSLTGGFLWGAAWTTPEANPGDGNSTAGAAILSTGRTSISTTGIKAMSVNRSDTGELITMHRAGTDVGSIDVSAGATAYNTSSDQRLKENVAAAPDPGAVIDAITVVQYDWINGGGHVRWGIVAQDEYATIPEAITPGDNGEEITKTWRTDPSKAVWMMLREIQLLRARVAALEAA